MLFTELAVTAWFALSTGLPAHRQWAELALVGYGLALGLAAIPRWRRAAYPAAFLGTAVVPLAWLAWRGVAQPEVSVLVEGARSLLASGSPYLANPKTLDEMRPYLPLAFVFGLPRALGIPGPLTDPRVLILLVGAFSFWLWQRTPGPSRGPSLPGGREDVRVGSLADQTLCAILSVPLISLHVAVSAIDLPLIIGLCWALTHFARTQGVAAGAAAAAAALIKPTAGALLPVLIASTWRLGPMPRRAAVRVACASAAAWSLVLGPIAAPNASGLIRNALLFPMGLSSVKSPAASNFPGVLIARFLPFGVTVALFLMALGILLLVRSFLHSPTSETSELADRVAQLLLLTILLAPASRAGYLVVPVLLAAWGRWLPRVSVGRDN